MWLAHEKGNLCKIINKQQDFELVVGLCNWLDLGLGNVSPFSRESSSRPLVNIKNNNKKVGFG